MKIFDGPDKNDEQKPDTDGETPDGLGVGKDADERAPSKKTENGIHSETKV